MDSINQRESFSIRGDMVFERAEDIKLSKRRINKFLRALDLVGEDIGLDNFMMIQFSSPDPMDSLRMPNRASFSSLGMPSSLHPLNS